MADAQKATEICLAEVRRCQQLSAGVCTTILLGNRYGFVGLPTSIPAEHYAVFTTQLAEAKRDRELALLAEWYRMDENHLGIKTDNDGIRQEEPEYVLCTSRIVGEMAKQRVALDMKTQTDLLNAMHSAAELAHTQGRLSDSEIDVYFQSVTEKEINCALECADNEDQIVCFMREFDDVDTLKQTYDSSAKGSIYPRFFDVVVDRPDAEKRQEKRLRALKEKLKAKLNAKCVFQFEPIKWDPTEGISKLKEHGYLRKFCECFEQVVFDNSIKRLKKRRSTRSYSPAAAREDANAFWKSEFAFDAELRHHARFCRQKLVTYVQRVEDEVLRNAAADNDLTLDESAKARLALDIKEFFAAFAASSALREDNELLTKKLESSALRYRKPFVIFGESGIGKTSLMANLVHNFSSKERESSSCKQAACLKIFRFCGTSPHSCTIRDVLLACVRQLCEASGFALAPSCDRLSVDKLATYIRCLIWVAALTTFGDAKILLMVDAIDQLKHDDRAHDLEWLPTELPENVFCFVSVLDRKDLGLVKRAKSIVGAGCWHEVKSVAAEEHFELVLRKFKQANSRTVSDDQREVIRKAFLRCPSPMFLKLALERAKCWTSFTDVDEVKALGENCEQLIQQFFDALRLAHGVAATCAIRYVTAAREGLTDGEMQDLLSLDDAAMQDVFAIQLPPAGDVNEVRFPPMVWKQIRRELGDNLAERDADGKTVFTWHHRLFREAAESEAGDKLKQTHARMVSYFSGEFSNKPKPLVLPKDAKGQFANPMRNVPSMPDCFDNDEKRPNLRKLTELAYHAIYAGDETTAVALLCRLSFISKSVRHRGFDKLIELYELFYRTFASAQRLRDVRLVETKKLLEESLKKKRSLQNAAVTDGAFRKFKAHGLEVKIVYNVLVGIADILRENWKSLSAQLVLRLSPFWGENFDVIKNLLKAAKLSLDQSADRLLVPQHYFVEGLGSAFVAAVKHKGPLHENPVCVSHGLLYTCENYVDKPTTINSYDLNSGEHVRRIVSCAQHSVAATTSVVTEIRAFGSSERFLLLTLAHRKCKSTLLTVLNVETEEFRDFKEAETVIATSSTTNSLLVYTKNSSLSLNSAPVGGATEWTVTTLPLRVSNADTIVTGAISPDNNVIVIGTKNGTLSVCTQANMAEHRLVEAEEKPCWNWWKLPILITRSSAIICRGLSAETASNVYIYGIWPPATTKVCHVGEQDQRVTFLALNQTEEWVAGATEGGTSGRILVWNTMTGETIFRISNEIGSVDFILAFCAGDHLLFDIRGDMFACRVRQSDRDAKAAKILRAVDGEPIEATETQLLIQNHRSDRISVWDLAAAVRSSNNDAKNETLLAQEAVKDSDEEEGVYAAKATDTKRIWKGNLRAVRQYSQICIKKSSVSKDGQYLIAKCVDDVVMFVNLASLDYSVVSCCHRSPPSEVNIVITSDCGSFAFTTSKGSPHIFIWHVILGSLLKRVRFNSGKVNAFVVHESKLYVSYSETASDNKLVSFDWETGTKEREFACPFPVEIFVLGRTDHQIVSWDSKRVVLVNVSSKDPTFLTLKASEVTTRPLDTSGVPAEQQRNHMAERSADRKFAAIAFSSVRPNRTHMCNFHFVHLEEKKLITEFSFESSVFTTFEFDKLQSTQAIILANNRVIVYDFVKGVQFASISLPNEANLLEASLAANGRFLVTSFANGLQLLQLHFSNIDYVRCELVIELPLNREKRCIVKCTTDLSSIVIYPWPDKASSGEDVPPLAVLRANSNLNYYMRRSVPRLLLQGTADDSRRDRSSQPASHVVRRFRAAAEIGAAPAAGAMSQFCNLL